MTIHGNLKRRGELIGANDLLVPAHARHLGLTLITDNTQGFSGAVAGLALEHWAASGACAPDPPTTAFLCHCSSMVTISPFSGKRERSCFEKIVLPSTVTSKTPPLPAVSLGSRLNLAFNSSANPLALGRKFHEEQ